MDHLPPRAAWALALIFLGIVVSYLGHGNDLVIRIPWWLIVWPTIAAAIGGRPLLDEAQQWIARWRERRSEWSVGKYERE